MLVTIDVKDVALWEVPITALRGPIKHGSHKWKMRLSSIMVINLPWYITKPINIVKSFMPDYLSVKF